MGPNLWEQNPFAVAKSKLQNPPVQATLVDLLVNGAQSVGAGRPAEGWGVAPSWGITPGTASYGDPGVHRSPEGNAIGV